LGWLSVKGLRDQQESQEAYRQSLRESYNLLVLTDEQRRRNAAEAAGLGADPETQRLLEKLELQEQIRRLTEEDRAIQERVDAELEQRAQKERLTQERTAKQLTAAELRKQAREQRRELRELEVTTGDFADFFAEMIVNVTDLGKRSFKDFADSVIQDLLRISARRFLAPQLSKLIETGIGLATSLIGGVSSISAPTSTGAGLSFGPSAFSTVGGSGEVGLFSGLTIGARAEGGPVLPGRFYTVGEEGPELLYSGSSSGRVFANTGRGGGNTFNFYGITDAVGIRRSQGEIRQFLTNATRQPE